MLFWIAPFRGRLANTNRAADSWELMPFRKPLDISRTPRFNWFMASNKGLANRWFQEVWNEGRENVIEELLASDCIAHGLADEHGNALRGHAGFKTFYHQFRGTFPDIFIDVRDVIEEGETVALRCEVRGTHRGDGLGIPATGRPVKFGGVAILRFQNGKIVEGWNHFDFHVLNQQLA
jgi:steroid delta-isomerase-like uncharacterized protein